MRKRILAMIIDYLIISLIISLIVHVPLFVYAYISKPELDILFDDTLFTFIMGLCLILILFKDLLFKNKSIGKKIMGIEIRDNNNKIPSFPILIFRNITVIIWPIECLLILLKKNRIGDTIFKTKIVLTENLDNIYNQQNEHNEFEIDKYNKETITKKRILSFFIDFFIAIILSSIIILILILYFDMTNFNIMIEYYDYICMYLLFKDLVFRNKSIGKKIMHLEVRYKNNKIPSIIVILIRDWILLGTCIIDWLLIILKKTTIGDIICNTKVVEQAS